MAYPEPTAGLVIRYSYLWRRQHLAGLEEGQKDRPCAIVAAIRREAGGMRVLVLPITHSEPGADAAAVEIPPPISERLGLDALRSWIVVSEYNEFAWPGPDLRPVPGSNVDSVVYGTLPPRFFETIRRALLERVAARRAGSVKRSD